MKWMIVILLLVPFVATAHGDANWIQRDPRYVTDIQISTGGYSHCCGPADCEMAPDDAIVPTPDGWVIPSTGQTIPFEMLAKGRQAFYSIDGKPWWCRRYTVGADGTFKRNVVCIFVPGEAS